MTLNHEPAVPTRRDFRIDFFRGLALLTVLIDHMQGNSLARLTPRNFGFSDGAELFAFVSGVSAALAYARHDSTWRTILGRVWSRLCQIYVTHVLLVLVVVGSLAAAASMSGNEALRGHATLAPFLEAPFHALAATMTLLLQPDYLNVLPLYLVLLTLLPLLIAALQRSLALTVAASVLVWALALATHLNLPSLDGGEWTFNPFSWQLLFVLGLACGILSRSGARLPRSHALLCAALGFIAFAAFARAHILQHMISVATGIDVAPSEAVAYSSKTYVSPWRLAHFLALAYVIIYVLPATSQIARHLPVRLLTRLGQYPLTVFAAATLMAIWGQIFFALDGASYLHQLEFDVIGLWGVFAATALTAGWYRRRGDGRKLPGPVRSPATPQAADPDMADRPGMRPVLLAASAAPATPARVAQSHRRRA